MAKATLRPILQNVKGERGGGREKTEVQKKLKERDTQQEKKGRTTLEIKGRQRNTKK